jgi:hypothetical protein
MISLPFALIKPAYLNKPPAIGGAHIPQASLTQRKQPFAEAILPVLESIADSGDKGLHAGLLANGNAYLITLNRAIYYGRPGHLKRLGPVTVSIQDRPTGPLRIYSSPALIFTMSNPGGAQQRVTVREPRSVLGIPLPFPRFSSPMHHRIQAAFRKERPIEA